MELLATGKMVLQTLNEAGYEAYFVGGMVRDQLIRSIRFMTLILQHQLNQKS